MIFMVVKKCNITTSFLFKKGTVRSITSVETGAVTVNKLLVTLVTIYYYRLQLKWFTIRECMEWLDFVITIIFY